MHAAAGLGRRCSGRASPYRGGASRAGLAFPGQSFAGVAGPAPVRAQEGMPWGSGKERARAWPRPGGEGQGARSIPAPAAPMLEAGRGAPRLGTSPMGCALAAPAGRPPRPPGEAPQPFLLGPARLASAALMGWPDSVADAGVRPSCGKQGPGLAAVLAQEAAGLAVAVGPGPPPPGLRSPLWTWALLKPAFFKSSW